MNFFPSKAEADIWMRDMGDHYEYIAVYVDDLLIVSNNPQGLIDAFINDHHFKLIGGGSADCGEDAHLPAGTQPPMLTGT